MADPGRPKHPTRGEVLAVLLVVATSSLTVAGSLVNLRLGLIALAVMAFVCAVFVFLTATD